MDTLHTWMAVDAVSVAFACAVSAMVVHKCGQTIAEVVSFLCKYVIFVIFVYFKI